MRHINEIVVHCAATRPAWWATRTLNQKVKEIRRWHVEDRGWSDIGYHYLIDRDGKVAEGRSLSRTGAHVRGHNTGSIGICLFGGHGSNENDAFSENFTPEQDRALRKLIADLRTRFPTIRKISGHNEYAAKACPGFRVSQWLATGPDAAYPPVRPDVEPADPVAPKAKPNPFAPLIAAILAFFTKGR